MRSDEKAQRQCPVCGGQAWSEFLRSNTGRIMTGDQRVIPGDLHKIECQECGVVANRNPFGTVELETLYQDEYQLNTGAGEEHVFFTPDGQIARSELFLQRIRPHIPNGARTVLEIGCGAGNLLARIRDAFPQMGLWGVEGSHRAAELAAGRDLHVRQGLVDGDTALPKSDVIVCLNVLEHVENLPGFLRAIRMALNDEGRFVLSLPVQDNFGYDIFFHEHVWHFGAEHVVQLLAANGFQVVAQECDHPVNPLIGLFVCEVADDGGLPDFDRAAFERVRRCVRRNRDRWSDVFARVDDWLADRTGRVAVFGAGEVFSLMWAFSSLEGAGPLVCLDEDTNKIGGSRHDIPVCHPDWLCAHDANGLLLCVNPIYHERIAARYAHHLEPDDIFAWDVHDATPVAAR